MSNETIAASGLAGLLEASLEDVADLPTFEVPAAGYYKLGLTITTKKINDKDAIEFDYKVLQVMELADPTSTPPIIGTKFSEAFQITNDIGLGKFKRAAAPVMEALGTTSFADILAGQVVDMEVYGKLKRRIHGDDKKLPAVEQRVYAEVADLTVS